MYDTRMEALVEHAIMAFLFWRFLLQYFIVQLETRCSTLKCVVRVGKAPAAMPSNVREIWQSHTWSGGLGVGMISMRKARHLRVLVLSDNADGTDI